MKLLNQLKQIVAPASLPISAKELRAELANHEARLRAAREPFAWISESHDEAATIECDVELAQRGCADKPSREAAETLVRAMLKAPRAAALRLAVELESGRSENQIRAVRLQSLRKLLEKIAAHADAIGDTEAALTARHREGNIGHADQEAEVFARGYIARCTDNLVPKPDKTKNQPVDCGYMGNTARHPALAQKP